MSKGNDEIGEGKKDSVNSKNSDHKSKEVRKSMHPLENKNVVSIIKNTALSPVLTTVAGMALSVYGVNGWQGLNEIHSWKNGIQRGTVRKKAVETM